MPSEDDIKQYLLENISEEKFKELKEEEKTQSKVHKRDGSFCVQDRYLDQQYYFGTERAVRFLRKTNVETV